MPAITVLLPVLNGMPYLREALASLEAQTFRDFEVLLWDNGSTDGTLQEARAWIPTRLPGRVVTNVPLPLHLCLARMVEEAATPFCARMDADDIALPARFAVQITRLETDPALAVVGGQMDMIDAAGTRLGPGTPAPLDYAGVLLGLLWHNPMAHPTVLFRREAVLEAGNYQAQKPVEDLDLWLRVATGTARLGNVPDMVLRYRRHAASVCEGERHSGALQQAVRDCLVRYSPKLFGLAAEEHLAMLHQNHPRALGLLEQALAQVAGRSGLSRGKLRGRQDYLRAGRMLTSRQDTITRLYLRLLETFAS